VRPWVQFPVLEKNNNNDDDKIIVNSKIRLLTFSQSRVNLTNLIVFLSPKINEQADTNKRLIAHFVALSTIAAGGF
jgi:hypothetical protein